MRSLILFLRDTFRRIPQWWRWALLLFFIFLVGYYPVGILWMQKQDRKIPNVQSPARAVLMAELLIKQQLRAGWVSNDPWFSPGSLLQNMKAYQQGVVEGVLFFVRLLDHKIGHIPGSSLDDVDLRLALQGLRYPPDVGLFHRTDDEALSSSDAYAMAAQALGRYRSANLEKAVPYRVDKKSVKLFLEKLGNFIRARVVETEGKILYGDLFSATVDWQFFRSRGNAHALEAIVQAFAEDFLGESKGHWKELTGNLHALTKLNPMIVLNAAPGRTFLGNALNAQLFYWQRALRSTQKLLEEKKA